MPKYTSLIELQNAIAEGTTTLSAAVDYYLAQIEATQQLNIYIEVYADEARQKAAELDAKYQADPASVGRLFGAIISLKDVICYADHSVTGGSKILTGFQSLFSATVVERILKEDAIIIGRVNCDEFAMGSTNENHHYGATLNAADPTRVPGGSSGGSAVAVQADTCLMSLGTDTGGSVRQPAAFCGVIGMKPTYGRISRYGLLAYGSSFDQIGTLTNSISDAEILLKIMAGPDDFDATVAQDAPAISSDFDFKNKKAKIAYLNIDQSGLSPDIQSSTNNLIAKLKADGHTVEGVDFDLLDYIIPAYYVLTTAEASSNLSRYDGVRFGHRSQEATDVMSIYTKSRTEGFGPEVKRRIMLGTFVLSAGYYDAYYTQAQKVRRLIQQRTFEILSEYDFIVMPAAPTPAWKIGEKTNDPVAMYLADIFTVQANMAGIPAIALPIGKTAEGLPIGIQFMAGKFEEGKLLAFGEQVICRTSCFQQEKSS